MIRRSSNTSAATRVKISYVITLDPLVVKMEGLVCTVGWWGTARVLSQRCCGKEKGGSHASKHQLTPAATCPRNCYSIQSYYTPCTFYVILDACDKTCTSVSECWKSYRIADHKVSVTESMDRLSRVWNGCWKKLWPEAVKVLQGAPKQQDVIRNILVLACKVLGEWIFRFQWDWYHPWCSQLSCC